MQSDVPVTLESPGRVKSMEKDATELELERLIFGDDDGFYEGLRSHNVAANIGDSTFLGVTDGLDRTVDGEDVDLEGVRDEDVRFRGLASSIVQGKLMYPTVILPRL